MRFIDISHWNGEIDFNKLKNDVDGVLMKVAQGNNYRDDKFETYYSQATAVGLPVGAYVFMVAQTPSQARNEANFALMCLKGKTFPLGVWLDVEDTKILNDSFEGNCKIELDAWENAGYDVGIYANLNWYKCYLTNNLKKYPLWIARYGRNTGMPIASAKPNVGECMWQYTSAGKVSGVSGYVDLNEVYKTFDAPQQTGFEVNVLTNLNVRGGAGTEYPVIDTIITKYKIYKTKKAKDGGTWGRTDKGWINISPKFVQRI